MKKSTFWLVALLVGSVVTVGLFAGAADDYQVIKNAVKKSGATPVGVEEPAMVQDRGDGQGRGLAKKSRSHLPVSLVEMMLNSCPEKKFNVEHGCEIDIQ